MSLLVGISRTLQVLECRAETFLFFPSKNGKISAAVNHIYAIIVQANEGISTAKATAKEHRVLCETHICLQAIH
jgi:hypothetical protein